MPRPNPIRNSVLKYLKSDFPYKLDLVVEGEKRPYAYDRVREAFEGFKDNDPIYYRILSTYCFTSLSRARAAEAIGFDSSTLKRYLDKAADIIMNRLNHAASLPADLFENRDPREHLPSYGTKTYSRFPKTVWRDA